MPQLADRISVPSKRHLTDAGQMIVPCAFARTGVQLYTAKQLNLTDKEPNEIIKVHRQEQDVFDEQSVASFRSAPVTIGHPRDEEGSNIPVTAENAKSLQVGMLEGMPVRDEDMLTGVLVLTLQDAIDALEVEGTEELSAGYTCDIEEVDGEYYQRNIKANHIAIVPKGRAGSSCRISDEAFEELDKVKGKKKKDLEISDEEAKEVDEVKVLSKMLGDAISEKAELDSELEKSKEELVKLTADHSKELEEANAKLEKAKEVAEEAVVERCKVIADAQMLADVKDFGSKSLNEIRVEVLTKEVPNLVLDGKSEEYICARFDVLVENFNNTTSMGNLLADTKLGAQVKAEPSPAVSARARMIETQKKLKS